MNRTELRKIIREEIQKLTEEKFKVSSSILKKYDIPSFALTYNSPNIPESGVYIDEKNSKVGYVTYVNGQPVVVIGKDKFGWIGTKAHNIREEKVNEIGPVGIWMRATDKDLKHFKKEIFDLIKQTYAPIGGHPKIKSPNDITTADISFWEFINTDRDPEPDAVSGAKRKPAGNKFVVGATDGSSSAKKAYIHSRINALKTGGNYVEVSHKIADILLSRGVPDIDNQKDVEKVLRKDVKWVGEIPGKKGKGWYIRAIGGKVYNKILLGKPKI